jgi:alpha/beta superfamily hydrolase
MSGERADLPFTGLPFDDKPPGFYLKAAAAQHEISFEAEDGWVIHGTLTIPSGYQQGEKLPAVLLVHSSRHSQTVWVTFPGFVRLQESFITLRIDFRGRRKSEGSIPFVEMSEAQRQKVSLDIKAAIEFLAAQQQVDAGRIGIAAEEFAAGPAVIAAMEDHRVRVFVLISGLLNGQALDLIQANTTKPILLVVSKEDKRGFRDMTKGYAVSQSPASDIWVQDGLGVGMTMCNTWRNRYVDRPIEQALDFAMGEWLEKKLLGLGTRRELTLTTEDGWDLRAILSMPPVGKGTLVPGVIVLPTALTDRRIYHTLERLFVASGIAVLNLEYRGIGTSTNKGLYIEQTYSEIMGGRRDLQQAFRFLISQDGIDPQRIGALGSILAAKYLRAIAILDAVVWPWDEEEDRVTLSSLDCPVLMVTGDGMGMTTRNFADLVARDPANKVIRYPGSIVAYLRFRDDLLLEPGIVDWFSHSLGPEGAERA